MHFFATLVLRICYRMHAVHLPHVNHGCRMQVERRVEVLNKRLDLIKELFDMLASELHTSHSNTLEWIVIILILVEVFFQILELFALDGFGAGLLGHN